MQPRSTIVLIDSYHEWREILEESILSIPEAGSLEVRGFAYASDAAQFVRDNKYCILGYILELDPGDRMSGPDFFARVIDPLTPWAKTLINTGFVGSVLALPRRTVAQGIDILQKIQFTPEAFREKLLWLLEPISLDKEAEGYPITSEVVRLLEVPPWKEIYRYIAEHPNYLHEMPPRKFEELIAHLFEDYGWEVDLTAPTKDGGYDILAVRRDLPTSLKVLVEVKRYTPDYSVGVAIVRALYGLRTLHSASQVILATSSHISRDAKREFERVVPWELDFIERDAILAWCRKHGGVDLEGAFTKNDAA